MCGIVGFIGYMGARQKLQDAVDLIAYRGKDGVGSVSDDNYEFAHLLHSVVDKVKQPLEKGDLIFGANCEIYNWKELKHKHRLGSKNDAELMFDLFLKEKALNERSVNSILSELDGVFAFFLFNKKTSTLILARDKIGVKPLWFKHDKGKLAFASEQKALGEAEELNPRKILFFNGKLKLFNQPFFDIEALKVSKDKAVERTKGLIIEAVEKRVPDRKLGLLFSGGLDSTLIAFLLKRGNVPFKCYMAVHAENNDAKIAVDVARKLGLDLQIINVSERDVEKVLPEVIATIESADPVKVEVGTTLYFALKQANKDNIKVIFSGLGADDIFGGYKRMRMAEDLTKDSVSSLRRIYERDLYRDDTLSMKNNIELRLPYLDKSLVEYVLNLPNEFKVGETAKPLLRKIAKELGMNELSELKRRAAQYGSGIHKAVAKLAKKYGFKSKSDYLASLTDVKNMKLGVLFSGGKDSTYALHVQKRLNYDIACLITVQSKNPDSFMFHTPSIDFVKYQAKAMDLPVIFQKTRGEEELELKDLKTAIKAAKDRYGIQGIVTGALFSNYQRSRIEAICDDLNLKVFSPLWHIDQENEMRSLIREKFKFIFTKVAAEGLDKSWLGRIITEKDVNRLVQLNKKLGLNIAGEGGEFETFVLDAPLFRKRLEIKEAHIENDTFIIDGMIV